MKAWLFEEFGNYDRLELGSVDEQKVGEKEVKLKVKAAGVNPIDRSVITGRFPWVSRPHIPGAEFAGEIVETGTGVRGLSRGDRVAVFPKLYCGKCAYCLRGRESACLENQHMDTAPYIIGLQRFGGWSEFSTVPAANAVKIPENVSFEQAATLPVDGTTAWHLVERCRPEPAERALVMGATGGVGTFAVQLLKMHGCEVIAAVGNDSQAEFVSRIGADHAVNRNREDVQKAVMQLTENRGVDVVIDPLGSATLSSSMNALSPMGRYATCGILTGPKAELSILRLYSMQIELIGSTSANRSDMDAVVSLMARGKLHGAVDSTFPFEEIRKALQRLDEHGRLGKVMLAIR
jgi:NADPH:quinone reductase-like Zn-dependent oxidoreductase